MATTESSVLKRPRSPDDTNKNEPKIKKTRHVTFNVSVCDSTKVNSQNIMTGGKPGKRCEDLRTEARARATKLATEIALENARLHLLEMDEINSTPWTPPGSPQPDGCSCS